MFGFIIEGHPEPDDIDPCEVHMHEFLVSDPTGEEQAKRDAAMRAAVAAMGPPRRFRMEGGILREVTGEQF